MTNSLQRVIVTLTALVLGTACQREEPHQEFTIKGPTLWPEDMVAGGRDANPSKSTMASIAFLYYIGGREGDEKAFYWSRRAAEKGDESGMFILAECYKDGRGTSQDYESFAYWCKKSAEAGSKAGQHGLGDALYSGTGMPRDYKEAAYWFMKAAEGGFWKSQFAIGVCYDSGHGVPKDSKAAVKWYRLAAEQGHVGAQFNLALHYLNGDGVPECKVEAYAWLNLAAVSDLRAIKARDNLERGMSRDDRFNAQEKSKELQALIAAKKNMVAK